MYISDYRVIQSEILFVGTLLVADHRTTVSVQTQIGGRNAIWTTFSSPKTSKYFYTSRRTNILFKIFRFSCILEKVLVTQKALLPSTCCTYDVTKIEHFLNFIFSPTLFYRLLAIPFLRVH